MQTYENALSTTYTNLYCLNFFSMMLGATQYELTLFLDFLEVKCVYSCFFTFNTWSEHKINCFFISCDTHSKKRKAKKHGGIFISFYICYFYWTRWGKQPMASYVIQ
ncbi:hypothetical protein ACH5RR_024545 [Cinchona calisaya]|uniref:Uncharacterized protein n=1 Tax=Cinchona calisaya TaxID=153742 RepID=A0ABD2YX13_9GENT